MTAIAHETFDPSFTAWINTAALDEIYSEYSDNYKSVHGIRPRWVPVFESHEEAADAFIRLGEEADAEAKRQEEEDARAIAAFETRVAEVIAIGAGDRETAIRWLFQGWLRRDVPGLQDIENWLWNLNLLHTTFGKQLAREVCEMYGF